MQNTHIYTENTKIKIQGPFLIGMDNGGPVARYGVLVLESDEIERLSEAIALLKSKKNDSKHV